MIILKRKSWTMKTEFSETTIPRKSIPWNEDFPNNLKIVKILVLVIVSEKEAYYRL